MRPNFFNYLQTWEELETYSKELFDSMVCGKLDVKVHEIHMLEDVAKAHTDLEGRKTSGKLVLKV